ncbi:MAG: hypothetical protein H0V81_17695 [Solirubrobacterales bacterium]|nr:hypothetical protein [Solirubrobacterales bacterium]
MNVNFEAVTQALATVFTELGMPVYSEEWTSAPIGEQLQLSAAIKSLFEVAGELRQPFDQTVWNGHESGRVSTDVPSIRAKSDFKNGRPGRVAQTLEQKLAAKLAAIVG